jgi:hypothetical protein
MANYEYDYYYAKRLVRILSESQHREGYILVGIRLEKYFMEFQAIRNATIENIRV